MTCSQFNFIGMSIMDFLASVAYKLMRVVNRARQIGYVVVINFKPLAAVAHKVIHGSAQNLVGGQTVAIAAIHSAASVTG
jgi:hypothetical protein